MANHYHVDCLRAVMAFTHAPPLALSAASPTLRLAAEHLPHGCHYGIYKIEPDVLPMPQQALIVFPSDTTTLCSVEDCVGWWLRKGGAGVYITIRWEDCYHARNVAPPQALPKMLHSVLRNLRFSRCHMKDSMAWVRTCRHLQVLVLRKCTFVNPDTGIKWIAECSSITDLKIDKCECVVDFRFLAKLQDLKTLFIITIHRLRYKKYIAKCQSLLIIYIDSPCHFFFDSTIAKLPRLVRVDIRCSSVHRVGSLEKCQLLERIRIHSETITNMSVMGKLPRLKRINAQIATMESIEWLENCNSLVHVGITNCTKVTHLEIIGKLQNITSLCLNDIRIYNIEWVRNCYQLERLVIGSCEHITDLSPIGSLQYLTKLNMEGIVSESIDWIEACDLLQHLYIFKERHITDYSCLSCLHSLKSLTIGSNTTENIGWLEGCKQLLSLHIANSVDIVDFRPIGKLQFLSDLDISRTMFTGKGWAQIESCHSLTKLTMISCRCVANFYPIAHFPCLTLLNLSGTRVADISWIGCCKVLATLMIAHCWGIVDFCPIGKLKYLDFIDMSYTDVQRMGWVKSCVTLRLVVIVGCDSIVEIEEMRVLHSRVIFMINEEEKTKILG